MIDCYNLIVEENKDPQNIDIKELEGHHEVNGPKIEMPNIMKSLKMRNLYIWSNVKLKYATIGYYWDEDIVSRITDLLYEY